MNGGAVKLGRSTILIARCLKELSLPTLTGSMYTLVVSLLLFLVFVPVHGAKRERK